jgi:putative transposase
MPRYRRHFEPGRSVFLTLVTECRRPWLRGEDAKRDVLSAMERVRRFHPFRNIGHVLLDDHLHWLIAPALAVNVSHLVGSMKRDISYRSPMRGVRSLWQPRFHDHVIRDQADLHRHLDYLHFNPVKHGYCKHASEYRWSSFSHWTARGVYGPDWGRIEPDEIRGIDAG